MKKRIALTCKDPGMFFHDCLGCKHYEKCDYWNKVKRKKSGQNLQSNCNHDYEFKASTFENPKWVNFYTCRKCGKRLKIYDDHRHGGGQL